jgi:hypothetical protein
MPDLSPDQAIQALKGLPEDRQRAILGRLSPEVKRAIMEKLSTPAESPRLQPEARTLGNYGSEIARGVGRGLKNDVVGAVDTVRHPIDTVTGLAKQGADTVKAVRQEYRDNAAAPMGQRVTAAALAGLEQAPVVGGMVQKAEQGGTELASPEAAGAAAEGITTYAAPEIAGRFVGPMTRSLKETVRKGSQTAVGAGESAVKSSVTKTAADAGKEAKATIKSNREATAEHAGKTADVKQENAEAKRAQDKIAPTQEKLKTAGRELQAQIETARNKALKVGNEKYNTVNEALSNFPADGEKMVGAVEAASEKISGSNTKPAILKDMSDRVFKDESFDYSDLQGYYSELGKELSKGTLPGDVYHALDTLHESIGDEMQRIADSQGKGAQLTDARNYWRRMKQTFGRPYNPTDAANVTLEKATGNAAEEEQANRVRLLGSFDPSIPQTVEHISNLRQGVEALGKPKPLREVVKPNPPKPEAKQIHAPEVNTREIREQLVDRWAKGESSLNKFQITRLTSGGIGALIGGVLHGELGAGAGATIGAAFGPAMIAKLAESPAVREWLTRPPAGELADLSKVPYADRIKITDGLKQVADKAGIKIAPLLARMMQAGALARYPHTATNGDGHRIGSHDGQQWFDVETGATK